jgi:hypothetical protein
MSATEQMKFYDVWESAASWSHARSPERKGQTPTQLIEDRLRFIDEVEKPSRRFDDQLAEFEAAPLHEIIGRSFQSAGVLERTE